MKVNVKDVIEEQAEGGNEMKYVEIEEQSKMVEVYVCCSRTVSLLLTSIEIRVSQLELQ